MYTSHEIPAGTLFVNLTTSQSDPLSLFEFLNTCSLLEHTDRGIYIHTQPVNGQYLLYVPSEKQFMEIPINQGAGGNGWRYLAKN